MKKIIFVVGIYRVLDNSDYVFITYCDIFIFNLTNRVLSILLRLT